MVSQIVIKETSELINDLEEEGSTQHNPLRELYDHLSREEIEGLFPKFSY